MKRLVALLLSLVSAATLAAHPHWVGTWATAAQPAQPEGPEEFHDQTLRLIVHVSIGGRHARIRLSNLYGDAPLTIGGAHLARRTTGADIDPASDRALRFSGTSSVTIPAGSEAVSDSVELDVTPLSDLAISLYLPGTARAMTSHLLALQTSFVASGDVMAAAKLPQTGTLSTWPLLIGVDVTAAPPAASVVAFGSSLTDGDGSTEDANHRWPDVLARRLQQAGGGPAQLGVLNQGIIGNRLLSASPGAKSPFGALLGESGLARFDRDVLAQPGVKYVLLCLGVNDILFPSFPFTPASEVRSADDIIAGYRQLIARAHARRVRIIGTTIPPFEGARFDNAGLKLDLYTPERDRAREAVNEWIRGSGAFDGVIDFDHAVRDPERPARIRPDFAAKDRLHVNDAGNEAQAGSIPLTLFQGN